MLKHTTINITDKNKQLLKKMAVEILGKPNVSALMTYLSLKYENNPTKIIRGLR